MLIGKIAELLGVSVQTIRYYEQQGLITPSRRDGGKYREYSEQDLLSLLDCIFYRNIGLSIKQIEQILHGADMRYITRLFEEQETRLTRQIEYNTQAAQYIGDLRKRLETMPLNLNMGNFWVWPEHVELPCTTENRDRISNIGSNSPLTTQWLIDGSPFMYLANHFDARELPYYYDESKGNFFAVTSVAHAKLLELPMDDTVRIVPDQLCMSVHIESADAYAVEANQLDFSLKRIEAQGYAICGPAVQMMMAPFLKDGKTHHYYWILIPVDKNL